MACMSEGSAQTAKYLEVTEMPYTKTKQMKTIRRAAAEEIQVRSAARTLDQKVREAGGKELAKLTKIHGVEAIKAIKAKAD